MHSQAVSSVAGFVELRVKRSEVPAKGLERRRYPRLDLRLSAHISVDERSYPALCLNVSAGGALLKLEMARVLPATFVVHLVMPALGDLPMPVIARRIEIFGNRVRLAFDPLPEALAAAMKSQMGPVRVVGKILN